MDIAERIVKLEKRYERMKDYLQLKFDEGDWHGVMDAAADIREILIEIKTLGSISNDNG